MRINHNIAALNTYRQLSANNVKTSLSLEKLSSGLRINRAGDDAAGLAISEKMRGQIRGLDQAGRNAQDGISMLQTAEGALNETHSILQRMRELVVQSQNDTNTTDDRAALDEEYQALSKEITRIGNDTEFNTTKLLNGDINSKIENVGTGLVVGSGIVGITSEGAVADTYTLGYVAATKTFTLTDTGAGSEDVVVTLPEGFDTTEVNFASLGIKIEINAALTADIGANNSFDVSALGSSLSLKIGANGDQVIDINIGDMRADALGGAVTKVGDTSVSNLANANVALTSVDEAITEVSTQRSKLGAYQNRLEHTISNLATSSENLTAAESRVRDLDMAKEMTEFTKNNILSQAAQAMLAQANQQPQGILQLLR